MVVEVVFVSGLRRPIAVILNREEGRDIHYWPSEAWWLRVISLLMTVPEAVAVLQVSPIGSYLWDMAKRSYPQEPLGLSNTNKVCWQQEGL
jgi:hypothetical protein